LPSNTVHSMVNAVHSQGHRSRERAHGAAASGRTRHASNGIRRSYDRRTGTLPLVRPARRRSGPSPPTHPRTRRRRSAGRHRPRRRRGPDLAARLGVVPGAVYRHVRNKQQLQDLVLDGVLAEVDVHLDLSLAWTEQLKLLAHRLRAVLEAHPGVAGILKTRDPLGPHSLVLAEAFLGPLQTAGFGNRDAGLAFFLLVDYTIGFAVSSPPTSVNEQRVRDPATRTQLHQFFRSLPSDRFPALVALGEHVWVDNRDERFTAGLDVLVDGLKHASNSPTRSVPKTTDPRPPSPPEDVTRS
jgi:AcrR family transcriptional regulator